jgi:hypothetical protein
MLATRCLLALLALALSSAAPQAGNPDSGALYLPAIGDTLDPIERDRYQLLGEYFGFQYAQFLAGPDGFVTARVALLVNGSEQCITLPHYQPAPFLRSWLSGDPARFERRKPGSGASITVELCAGGVLAGELISARDTALVICTPARCGRDHPRVPREELLIVRNQDISRVVLHRDARVLRRAGMGLLVGGVAGALVGAASGDKSPRDFWSFTPAEGAAILGIAGAGTGAIIGGFTALGRSSDRHLTPGDRDALAAMRAVARFPDYEPEYLGTLR